MNIQNLIDIIKDTVMAHRLDKDGEYARYLWQNDAMDRKLGLNEYGCADAINILYTINDFVTDDESRKKHIMVLQSMQNPETGKFEEKTHHFIHTCAHCTAALELFDKKPLYRFKCLDKYKTIDGLKELLNGLDWQNCAWPESHKGAGIYAALKLNDEIDEEWERTYFRWLWDNADSKYGFWKSGVIENNLENLYTYMGAGFHYLFNIEYAKMPIRYPERIIDACLELYNNHKIGTHDGDYKRDMFGKNIGFLEVDWIYSITRSMRKCDYRRHDCVDALNKFADGYIDWLFSIDHRTHDGFNDIHLLFGACCALAELQSALPGKLITKKPLRLVLDRRPFI